MDFSIAVRKMNMNCFTSQTFISLARTSGSNQMADIDVGGTAGQFTSSMKRTIESISYGEERVGKAPVPRHSGKFERGGVVPKTADIFHARPPLLGRTNPSTLPDVFPEHQKDIASPILVGEVEILSDPIDTESLNAWIEIDQSDGDAADRNNRRPQLFTFGDNQAASTHINIERVGEDVNRVEADLFCFADAPCGVFTRLNPAAVDQPQSHVPSP